MPVVLDHAIIVHIVPVPTKKTPEEYKVAITCKEEIKWCTIKKYC